MDKVSGGYKRRSLSAFLERLSLRAVWHFVGLLLAVICGSTFAGCSSVERFQGVQYGDNAKLIVPIAPILVSEQMGCGPACLLAVTDYWASYGNGPSVDPWKSQIPLHGAHSADDLKQLAVAWGYELLAFEGEISDIDKNVAQGRPLIVMVPAFSHPYDGFVSPIAWLTTMVKQRMPGGGNHWVLVRGVDNDGSIIIHDPARGSLTVARSYFERRWQKRDRLCLLVFPKSGVK